jgi:hypothetical protein
MHSAEGCIVCAEVNIEDAVLRGSTRSAYYTIVCCANIRTGYTLYLAKGAQTKATTSIRRQTDRLTHISYEYKTRRAHTFSSINRDTYTVRAKKVAGCSSGIR